MANGKPGRPPLPTEVVEQCRRLLAEGFTERKIAILLRISKGTIYAVRTGKYGNLPPAYRRRRHLPKPVRCGGCGGMIEDTPCLLCLVRRRRKKRVPPATAAPSPFLRRRNGR
jgi:hypothetical protein